jgi:hypothetical protein
MDEDERGEILNLTDRHGKRWEGRSGNQLREHENGNIIEQRLSFISDWK